MRIKLSRICQNRYILSLKQFLINFKTYFVESFANGSIYGFVNLLMYIKSVRVLVFVIVTLFVYFFYLIHDFFG